MDKETEMRRIYTFLKDAGTFYIASLDGEQPRVRPFGRIHIYKGRLYTLTGRSKACYRQFVNGRIELCAIYRNRWLRLEAQLVEDPSIEAQEDMLVEYPNMRSFFEAGDGNTVVLYFTDMTARYCSWTEPDEIVKL